MNVFFTADLHLGHGSNKAGYGGILFHAHRPFASLEEMDEKFISNWNEMVKAGDHTWILGDFAWRNHSRYLHRLNGKKSLVLGSHDKMSQDVLRLFAEVHDGMARRQFNKVPFFLTHCAMRVWESSHYGSVNLYGHSHGRLPEFEDRLQMDVGVDVWDYKPIPLELILWIISKRGFKPEGRRTPEELEEAVTVLARRNFLFREEFKSKINT